MKTIILAAIRCSLMFLVTASLFSVRPAQAGYIVTLHQRGPDVVATGSGAIDLTGLSFLVTTFNSSLIFPNAARITTGVGLDDIFSGMISGPTSFGSGSFTLANTGSGDFVGIFGEGSLFVPTGYVSGNFLSDSSTYYQATFTTLGVTPGTYVWTWGAGGANQNFTLVIGSVAVPDGGSTVSLLGCALLGLAAVRRKFSC
jgi:hypothetical protein